MLKFVCLLVFQVLRHLFNFCI